MAKTFQLQAYLPWWFVFYLRAVYVFAWMTNLDVDTGKVTEQARKAIRFRKLEIREDQQ
ncbi:hypothetical protein HK44_020590 [Pseudomonas fluorescens HK44]|uniref:Uncharacterized protein n=1 Tax=Pseudomonas fluorescens HK44 TaxID=1042209 RepID=A0A010RVM5_PSEFL|nr:hypothetical protein [Pseudomonas fluorescens]EXF96286.1 hypothetical protein HK44_020590 [Pseudomonas fluorescens HK44]